MKKHLLPLLLLASLAITGCDLTKKEETITPEPETPVVVRAPKAIFIEGFMEKSKYEVGDRWDNAGMNAAILYTDNSTLSLDKTSYELTFEPAQPTKGLTTVQVTPSLIDSELNLEIRKATFSVTVTEKATVSSIELKGELNKTQYNLTENWDSTGLYVEGTMSDGETKTLDKNDYTFVFEPSKPALSTESVKVYAKLNSNETIVTSKQSFNVTVVDNAVHVTSVSLNKTSYTMDVGDTYKLTETVLPTNATDKTVTWDSLNKSVATVSKGTITAISQGTTTIVVETNDGNFTAECNLTVNKKEDTFNGYYNSISSTLYGESLRSALHNLINKSSVSTSYDWSRFEDADEDPNNSSNIITVYARTSLKKTAHVSGSVGWNREHSFPQSKMDGGNGSKSDNHIIFASDNKVNGKRSNYRLRDLTGMSTQVVIDGYGNSTPCRFYDSGEKFFDPGDTQARGIVARATMYAAAMYNYDPADNIFDIETMLSWHLAYYPNENDARRNEVVYGNQHNRNPFVDHPEYAIKIWGNSSNKTRQICGLA